MTIERDYSDKDLRAALGSPPPLEKIKMTDNRLADLIDAVEPFVEGFLLKRIAYSKRYQDRELGFRNFDKMPDAWPTENLNFKMGEFRELVSALARAKASHGAGT